MLQGLPDLSATVARLRRRAATRPRDADRQIDEAAQALNRLPGAFIFVGASPIRVGLQLLRLAPDRDCRFVPFTGGWMRPVDHDRCGDILGYDRIPHAPALPFDAYRRRILSDLTAEALCDRNAPLNLVDCVHSGKGLLSFADLLVAAGENSKSQRAIAARLNLVSITNSDVGQAQAPRYRWRTRDSIVEAPALMLPMAAATWQMLVGQSGPHFHPDDPRLTLPYPAAEWQAPPRPAPATNIAAFRRAAQGIAPERLRLAGLALPAPAPR